MQFLIYSSKNMTVFPRDWMVVTQSVMFVRVIKYFFWKGPTCRLRKAIIPFVFINILSAKCDKLYHPERSQLNNEKYTDNRYYILWNLARIIFSVMKTLRNKLQENVHEILLPILRPLLKTLSCWVFWLWFLVLLFFTCFSRFCLLKVSQTKN